MQIYDFAVIGGGSGGLACAKRAAGYGASVAVIEGARYGGTCVNVGCVPKKVMWNASFINETIHQAKEFGFTVGDVKFDWGLIKRYRDRYIQRLNGIYENGLDKMGITRIGGFASFVDAQTLQVAHEDGSVSHVKARKILIAVGGTPNTLPIPGGEHVIDSDGFFALESQPRKVAVLGAGYIAVELAGVFHGLGTDTSLFCRGEKVLRTFDPMIQDALWKTMASSGLKAIPNSTAERVVKESDGTFTITFTNGSVRSIYSATQLL